jgi:small subunit ribosomal protein S13
MAEKPQTQAKEKAPVKAEAKPAQRGRPEERTEALIRIYGYDIPGSRNIYAGLTRIKGVSWAISNATCLKLNLEKTRKIVTLSKDDIAKIENFLNNVEVPEFMKNRRFDRDTGETKHLYTTDLDMAKEFDIKRLKKIKSYKGVRHAAKQPVRGQRTRSHFRTNRKKSGGIKKNDKKA